MGHGGNNATSSMGREESELIWPSELLRRERSIRSAVLCSLARSCRPPNHFLFSLVHDWKSEVVTKAVLPQRNIVHLLFIYECLYHCAAWEMNAHFYRSWLREWRNQASSLEMWTSEESFSCRSLWTFRSRLSEKNTHLACLRNLLISGLDILFSLLANNEYDFDSLTSSQSWKQKQCWLQCTTEKPRFSILKNTAWK